MADEARPGWTRWLTDQRVLFVAVNLLANLLVLGRSLVALRLLGEADLGRVTIVQTLVLVAGFLQFGLWNGGYRLLCENDPDEARRLTRMAWLWMAGLALLAGLGLVGALAAGVRQEAGLLLAGGLAGLFGLARNWAANHLIALGDLGRLNALTAMSAAASLAPLLFVSSAPLWAVIASIAAQPLVFLMLAVAWRHDLLPTCGPLDTALARRAFGAGFALFAVGLLLQANLVVERGFVLEMLGLDSLGRLFLAYLFITLFQLVPASFDAIFLRRVVAVRQGGDRMRTGREIGVFLGVTVGYCALVVAATLIAGPLLIGALFPERGADFPFVLAILPGLVLFTLASPLAVMFNVLIDYRAFWIAYGAGTALTLCGLGLGWAGLVPFDLAGVAGLRGLAYGVTGAILITACIAAWRRHPEFRPRLRA